MPITQNDIDQVIPELNEAIGLHNVERADWPLRQFSENKRIVILGARKELENLSRSTLDRTSAFYHWSSGNIFVVKENIGKEIEQMRMFGEMIQNTRVQMEQVRMGLLNLLSHENVHRSCKNVTQPAYVCDNYLNLGLKFYKGTPAYRLLGEVARFNGKMRTRGLLVEFCFPKNKTAQESKEMDEFVTDYLSSSSLSAYIAKIGIFKDRRVAEAGLMMNNSINRKGDYLPPLNAIDGHPKKDLVLGDYLRGHIAGKLIDSAEEKGEFDSIGTSALIGHLTGRLSLFPDLIQAIYGPGENGQKK